VHGAVRETVPMRCQRLDALLEPDRTVDFLKLDVEGAELRVMQGAEKLFKAKRVLFVYTEFVMLPFYAEHPLFGDQQAFLRDHGLRLIDLELNHLRYTRDVTPIGDWADRRLLHAGDACFVLDPDLNELTAIERQRLAAISLALGFSSFGIGLLREAGLTPAGDVDAIERALTQVPLPRLLRRTWNEVPYAVFRQLQRLRRLVASRA